MPSPQHAAVPFNDPTPIAPLTTDQREALYRRTLIVVVFSQIFGGAGLAAGVTVGALLAQEMLGSAHLAGLPVALFTLGSAGAAFAVGRISQRRGRRVGLSAGFFTGSVGALLVVAAAVMDNIALLFAALIIYGAGTATNLQARYAGTDLAAPHRRATAVSIAMVSTTLGAVAGPNLVTPMGALAVRIGIPALAGPFLLAAAAYLLAGAVLHVWLRPDPLLVASAFPAPALEAQAPHESAPGLAPAPVSAPDGGAGTGPVVVRASASAARTEVNRGVIVGTTVMILTQFSMAAIMTMTPVRMTSHGFGMTEVGIVIGVHIGAMYLPSLITGLLVDKLGRQFMSIMSGVTLFAAGLTAATAPDESMAQLVVALALLGVGPTARKLVGWRPPSRF